MVSYRAMAERGRTEAYRLSQRRQVAVVRYEWTQQPTRVGRWVEPCPPFVMKREWRVEVVGTHWECAAIAECGHTLQGIAHGVTEGVVPAYLLSRFPIGKKKPCEQCPPRDPEEGAPPDEIRCTYRWDTEFVENKRCKTRARWTVTHVNAEGVTVGDPFHHVCEKHRRQLIEWGGIMPEPRPYPHGYTDGGWDVVEKFTPPAAPAPTAGGTDATTGEEVST